jgi:RimJ/RimL family protein N-acetyltransferase
MSGIEHSSLRLLDIEIRTNYLLDGQGRLLAVNVPDHSPAPRFVFARTAEGVRWYAGHDVADGDAATLGEMASRADLSADLEAPFTFAAEAESLLSATAPIQRVVAGPYFIAADPVEPWGDVERLAPSLDARPGSEWERSVTEASHLQPCYAFVEHGDVLAICFSSRTTTEASEAGVETREDARGRGLAVRVVSAWAAAVQREGRIAFYSTSWENAASRAVAQKAGFRMYASCYHVT